MRYLDAPQDAQQMFDNLLDLNFQHLQGITFKLIFDTKKRVSRGNIVLSSTELSNEKIKFYTADGNAPVGYECIIFIDAIAWQYASEDNKRKMLSHELQHVHLDDKGKLKLVGHDVEDFAAEIVKNADDPAWASKLATLVRSIYEQQEEQ